ncbi:MAG: ribosome-associated translation inhibitor RaiA [Clostridia bacterium]|nr:ribosome-associated translation inhibitor RaiA [Clostridia bacterium]
MNLQLHGKNIDVTPALREYAEKKLSRLGKYFDEPLHVQVSFEVERGRHLVEVTVPVSGYILRGEEATGDMYASLDRVWDKLERQIHKYKTRLNRKARQDGGAKKPERAKEERTEDPSEDLPRIVRVKRFHLKPMDVDEAVLQMDLLGHDFYVFQNAETDVVNVLYRRREGGYGLIEPAR